MEQQWERKVIRKIYKRKDIPQIERGKSAHVCG